MIKKILIALDPDQDTSVATRYAIRFASKDDIRLTGLAVVDTHQIAAEIGGGGIGTIYYQDSLRQHLSTEARKTAKNLTMAFIDAVEKANLQHSEQVEEGVPFERIIEDMKYHDLLIIGKSPHFFYSKPERKDRTLARVVKRGVAPVLIVGNEYTEVKRILLAYDGSDASARTMQRFAQLQPFGLDIELDIVHVRSGETDIEVDESELLVGLAADFMEAHGFRKTKKLSLPEGPSDERLLDYVRHAAIDLVVAGAHSVSAMRRITFGSTTYAFLEDGDTALFLFH